MKLALSLAPLFVASIAYAQAPGETPIAPPPAAESCDSSLVQESVMANRWAVGLSIGHMTVAPDATPDSKSEFGYGELSLRFRATLHLELELAVGGGRQQLDKGQDGDLESHTGILAARWRFFPQHKWNFYVEAGLGGAAIVHKDASDKETNNAMQPLGMFGVGLERRWNHFALAAELRGIGMGEKKQDTMAVPATTGGGTDPGTTMTQTTIEKRSGGTFTIGASYYF